jgi:inorganic pyrophosphatase
MISSTIMKNTVPELPAFDSETGDLNVIIETPQGSRNKYAYDPQSGLVRLKKLLPRGMVYPFDFGFIPSTRGGDGDPLDVLMLSEEALFPGCLVKARIIGALQATQREEGKTHRNDRLIGLPVLEFGMSRIRSIRDLDARMLEQIECFFVFSHQLEGKPFEILKRVGATAARALVEQSSRGVSATLTESP